MQEGLSFADCYVSGAGYQFCDGFKLLTPVLLPIQVVVTKLEITQCAYSGERPRFNILVNHKLS